MAAFDKRGISQWRVRVRKRGHNLTKTFDTKAEAETWAQTVESEIGRGVYVDRTPAETTRLNEVIEQYIKNVAPRHKGGDSEISRLRKIIRDEPRLMKMNMAQIRTSDFEDYRDKRSLEVTPSTIKRELGLLHAVIETVRKRLGMIENPVTDCKRPKVNDSREIRFRLDEEEKLLAAFDTCKNPYVKPCVIFALETAMRRGEILSLTWNNVDVTTAVAHLPITKTGTARSVPLSPRALDILKTLPHSISGKVFPLHFEALKSAFQRARKKAGMEHFNFHDLRHEATSRLFERGWNIMEVSAVTGHKDLQSLKRYTQLRPEDLAKKMAAQE